LAAIVDHARYNDLPSLGEADLARQDPSVDAIMNGPIRDVFRKHASHLTHCLYLQHRHHLVGADEAVVKVEGTAHLMNSQQMKEISSFGNKIVPSTWMTSAGKVLPMEFEVVPADVAAVDLSPAFVAEFVSVLLSHGLDKLFGIDTIAKDNWAELKIGDASVVVPDDDKDTVDADGFIQVAFVFEEDKPQFKVHGKCKKDHKHTTKPARS
ncbi:hypothetical protein B0T24DRAFT_529687, partial [Lasiosphaeria ovina]